MTLVDALQQALRLEHQAVYGYGLVIAQLRTQERRWATDALIAHQTLRDQIASLIASMHAAPTPAAPAYVPPTPVHDADAARSLAAAIEDAVTGSGWDVVAAAPASSPARRLAVGWLSDAADRGDRWHVLTGTQLPALPGQPS